MYHSRVYLTLNILYFNRDSIGTAIHCIRTASARTFLFLVRCIVPNWRRKRPRKVYRIARAVSLYIRDCDSARGRTTRLRDTLDCAVFARERPRERRKGKLYSVGRRQKKKVIHEGIPNPAKAEETDARAPARSPFVQRAVDFIVDQIPTAAQNRDQRDQRWSYCSWFVTTNFMSRQRDRPVVPPLPSPPPRH